MPESCQSPCPEGSNTRGNLWKHASYSPIITLFNITDLIDQGSSYHHYSPLHHYTIYKCDAAERKVGGCAIPGGGTTTTWWKDMDQPRQDTPVYDC
ncbi:hypothetical protein RB195_002057 [Necator americanus]|uniref:SCP domain-containing protein n=1 Tax=Necator americanus TaxID=51031 RepID=A0ABR1DHG9_NECAM